MRIGIDFMGSDVAPQELMSDFLATYAPSEEVSQVVCFVTEETSSPEVPQEDIVFVRCPAQIHQEENPLEAVRVKRNSTLMEGMSRLARGEIDALISAGNTGAVVAAAALVLPKLPTIRRPALLAFLPTHHHQLALLDVGGLVTPTVATLVASAKMGVAAQQALQEINAPRVALLNIGQESQKGTSTLKEAYRSLEHMEGFVGNVEGREAFDGHIDVLVADGFTGNIFLKTAEGVAALVFKELAREALEGGVEAVWLEALQRLNRKYDYHRYPGAIVCGVDRILLKCHGVASSGSLCRSLEQCVTLHTNGFLPKMRKSLAT